jgi:hypothetical protein
MFAAIEQHLAAYAKQTEEAVLVHVREFIEWAKGEQAKVEAAEKLLTSHGYTVTAP